MLRRSTPLKPSRGTVWPADVREAARRLHPGCMGPVVGMPKPCNGHIELDHIRSSGGMGMKSRSTLDNAARLCFRHHQDKGLAGRKWRPLLIELVDRLMGTGCGHVDRRWDCDVCQSRPIRARSAGSRP